MGWLGWSAEQALDTPMPLIALALDGRMKMLRAIFGGGDPHPQPRALDRPALAGRIDRALRSLAGTPRRKTPRETGHGNKSR